MRVNPKSTLFRRWLLSMNQINVDKSTLSQHRYHANWRGDVISLYINVQCLLGSVLRSLKNCFSLRMFGLHWVRHYLILHIANMYLFLLIHRLFLNLVQCFLLEMMSIIIIRIQKIKTHAIYLFEQTLSTYILDLNSRYTEFLY